MFQCQRHGAIASIREGVHIIDKREREREKHVFLQKYLFHTRSHSLFYAYIYTRCDRMHHILKTVIL